MTSIDFCAKNFGQARLVAKQLSLPINRILGQAIRLSDTQYRAIQSQIALLDQGYPLDYLLGLVNFCGKDFVISSDVLIPRPATEYWVNELILELEGKKLEEKTYTLSPVNGLIEIGTGSGVIGLTLTPFFDKVILSDISIPALEIAKINTRNLYPDNFGKLDSHKIELINSDLLQEISLPSSLTSWMLIANLPYVPIADQEKNHINKVGFEPAIALYSGDDGLDLIKKLIDQLTKSYGSNMPSQIWLELDPRNICNAKKYIQEQFQSIILKQNKKWIYNILTDEDDFARVLVIKQIAQ